MKKRLIVDILLFVLMILEFSRMYMPTIFHEIIGLILLMLFIIHIILNINYIANIPKGKYNLKRIMMLIINIAFMITFLLSLVLGILSSQDILRFMNVGDINIVSLHKTISYISLVCMGMHLGINFNAMFGKIIRLIKGKIFLYILSIIIIIFGIYSWINLDIWNHLIGKYGFSIMTGNLFMNFLKYLSISMMIAIVVNFIYKILGGKKDER